MKIIVSHLLWVSLLALFLTGKAVSQSNPKPRTIVTTDGELDDVDSFIRMLLYANEFKLEGLVYSSSQWHYKGDGKGTKMTSEIEMTAKRYGERTELRWPGTTWMQELLDEYQKVQPNLAKHAKGYPTAGELKKLVKVGNIDFEGEMEKETEGSEWIKKVLLDENPQPVYLQIWGGTNTVARALKSIEETYKTKPNWKDIYEKVSKKAIIYAVLDQDATYKKYIAPNWGKIRVFYNSNQFWCLAYPWTRVVPAELQPYLRGEFIAKNIIQNHGPLLAKYYSWGDGQKIAGDPEHTQGTEEDMQKNKMTKYDFISEGDSPAYFQLLEVGLMNRDNPEYGGWGGRMTQSPTNPYRWEDARTLTDYNHFTKKEDASFPQTRWIDALQLDFAARADWCVKGYKSANHAPIISVKEGNSINVKAGQKIALTANATDPDGHTVSYTFWHYREAGTSPEKANIEVTGAKAAVQIPQNAKSGDTIHIIVEGKDNGEPALIRYQRVILTVS
ncbi:nucleoside hydrolase-like domain-containing protein [Runella sp.]|uniref:nucleoside hydrolase-like domain-containing protein n=1 Tax=Runella sp. TaxID=1960881 RepID=UPI003D10815E